MTTAPSHSSWRREAALRLGADEAVARRFGETGVVELGGQPLSLHPLQDDPTGPWMAVTRAARPAGVSEAAWHEALLLATTHSLAVTHAAYGLADDGDGVVMLRTPAGHDHPDLLAAELAGLLGLRQALVAGVQAPAMTPPPAPAPAVAPGPTPLQAAASAAADTGDAADLQEFEAPEDVLVLVHGAMLHLGFSAQQALAAARSGALQLEGVSIGLACDADGGTLVVAADLGTQVLHTPAERRLALLANTELMVFVGAAMARERGSARLMSRCYLGGCSAAHFAAWLREFARLARITVEHRSAAAVAH
jgi:hypothetical protein